MHRHTLAVEVSARLLLKGMLEPDELLSALLNSSANPDSADKIRINKDGVNTKATYYNHIRTLFSLYLLDEDKQSIMRCMVFVRQTGIRARMFAKWLGLNKMDDINELALFYDCQSAVEAFINENYNKAISLSKKAVEACVPEENLHLAVIQVYSFGAEKALYEN